MTSEPAFTVLAPGKAMLIGEYAVLDGAPAAVAAVDRYASCVLASGEPASPFIGAALDAAREALARLGASAPAGTPRVDTDRFSEGGRKLGVGSSAAATVAAVGALFAGAGLDPAAFRGEIHRTAAAAHAAAQGERGSGADVLAATHGGVQALHRAAPARPLPALVRFVSTSTSASTAALLRRLREVGDAAAPVLKGMAAAADQFFTAWDIDNRAALFTAVEAALSAYQALGEVLGAALVTDEHAAIAAAARRAGGAAKPSGAGGGDLAVVFLPDSDAEAALRAGLPPAAALLPMQISAEGVHAVWSA